MRFFTSAVDAPLPMARQWTDIMERRFGGFKGVVDDPFEIDDLLKIWDWEKVDGKTMKNQGKTNLDALGGRRNVVFGLGNIWPEPQIPQFKSCPIEVSKIWGMVKMDLFSNRAFRNSCGLFTQWIDQPNRFDHPIFWSTTKSKRTPPNGFGGTAPGEVAQTCQGSCQSQHLRYKKILFTAEQTAPPSGEKDQVPGRLHWYSATKARRKSGRCSSKRSWRREERSKSWPKCS